MGGADPAQILKADPAAPKASMLLLEDIKQSSLSSRVAPPHSYWQNLHLAETAWAAQWQAYQTGANVEVRASDINAPFNFISDNTLKNFLKETLPHTDVVSTSEYPEDIIEFNVDAADLAPFKNTVVMETAGNDGAEGNHVSDYLLMPTEMAPLVVNVGAASHCLVDEYSSKRATLVAADPYEGGLRYNLGMPPDKIAETLAEPGTREKLIRDQFKRLKGITPNGTRPTKKLHLSYDGSAYVLSDVQQFSEGLSGFLDYGLNSANNVAMVQNSFDRIKAIIDRARRTLKTAHEIRLSQSTLDKLGPAFAEYFSLRIDDELSAYRQTYAASSGFETNIGGTSFSTPPAGTTIAASIAKHRDLGAYGNYAAAIFASFPIARIVKGEVMALDYEPNAAGLLFNDTYAGFGLLENGKLEAVADQLSELARQEPESKIIPIREKAKGDSHGLKITFHMAAPATTYRVLFKMETAHPFDADIEPTVDIESPSRTHFTGYPELFSDTGHLKHRYGHHVATTAFFGEGGKGNWVITLPKEFVGYKMTATMTLIGVKPGSIIDDALHGGIDYAKLPPLACAKAGFSPPPMP